MNIHIYLKHWIWFIVSLLSMLILGKVYLFLAKPIYRIQASLSIEDSQKGNKVEYALKEVDHFTPNKLVENEIEVLKSYQITKKVVDKLNLTVRYFVKGDYRKKELYGDLPFKIEFKKPSIDLYESDLEVKIIDSSKVLINDKEYLTNKIVNSPYGQLQITINKEQITLHPSVAVRVRPTDQVIQEYLANLKVTPTSKSSTVLLVTIEDGIPKRGEEFIEQLLEEYRTVQTEEKRNSVASTLYFIKNRLALVSEDLHKVEKSLENYKSKNKITDITSDSKSLLEKIQRNDSELNQVLIQSSSLDNIEKYINDKGLESGIIPATVGLNNPGLVNLIDRTIELERQRDNLIEISSTSNPLLKTLNKQIAGMKNNIKETIQNLKTISSAKKIELSTLNKRYESVLKELPAQEQALLTITRQQAVKSNLYTYLLQKQEETSLAYASTASGIRIIDPAHTDPVPAKPIKSLMMLLFTSLGLLIPVVVITIKNLLGERVTGRSDIDELTQVPIMGEIANSKHKRPIFITDHSIAAEQIRALRTNLQLFRADRTSLALLTTSGISGEGKSFLCSNLSASLALLNEPTVLLEMDFRKPELHSIMGVPNTIGLSDYLENRVDIDQILLPIAGIPNLWILTCGSISDNPSELLSSHRLEELFYQLRQKFTYIIVDAPPIGLVTDAQIISKYTDMTLYMIRYYVTPKQSLYEVEHLYQKNIFPKLNLILNSSNSPFKYNYKYYKKRKSKRIPIKL